MSTTKTPMQMTTDELVAKSRVTHHIEAQRRLKNPTLRKKNRAKLEAFEGVKSTVKVTKTKTATKAKVVSIKAKRKSNADPQKAADFAKATAIAVDNDFPVGSAAFWVTYKAVRAERKVTA